MLLTNWKKVSPGGVLESSGSSAQVETGSWRSMRPVLDLDRCVHCMICWAYCPDSSFIVKNDKLEGIDYEHCKGCGICAKECPKKCIEMQSEFSLASGGV